MNKNILLTIITENQTQKVKAEKLAELLKNELGEGWETENIEKYYKFENSFKIELKKTFSDKTQDKLNLIGISLADRLVSPWLVYYDKDENSVELIFNKDNFSRIRKTDFNVIRWGQLLITEA